MTGMGKYTYATTNGERCLTNYGEIDGEWYLERADLGLPNTKEKKHVQPVATNVSTRAAVNGVKAIKPQTNGIAAH